MRCCCSCSGEDLVHGTETGKGQAGIGIGERALHGCVETLDGAVGANNPTRLKPDVRDVDQTLRRLRYGQIGDRLGANGCGTFDALLLGDIPYHADDSVGGLLRS